MRWAAGAAAAAAEAAAATSFTFVLRVRYWLNFVCGSGGRTCTWYHGVFGPGNGMQTRVEPR